LIITEELYLRGTNTTKLSAIRTMAPLDRGINRNGCTG